MITPDTPDRVYSTRLRTALVLTGSGTSAAYHAGVLRALHEAGVKWISSPAAAIGVVGALFAAVDGGARLWEADGIWKARRREPVLRLAASRSASPGGRWRLPPPVLAIPLVLLALAVVLAIIGLLLTLVGLSGAATAVTSGYAHWIETLFSPTALPTVIPRLALFAGLVALGLSRWERSEASARGGSVAGPDRESPAARFGGPISRHDRGRTGARPSCGT